jgi:hypothetical protein
MSYARAPRKRVRMGATSMRASGAGHRHWWEHREGPSGKFSYCRCGEQREGHWMGDRQTAKP